MVAQEILSQIGGARRISMMTGAKNFVSHSDGLSFRLPRNHIVKITLNGNDLYDIDYQKYNSKTLEIQTIEKSGDNYVDMLIDQLEKITKLYFKL